jgi:hypothetical protein
VCAFGVHERREDAAHSYINILCAERRSIDPIAGQLIVIVLV